MTPDIVNSSIAIRRALLCFLGAYCAVTVFATALTVTYGSIYKSPQHQDLAGGLLKDPAFVATVPYHVVIMLVVWPAFAWLYFRRHKRTTQNIEVKEALYLSIIWLAGAIVVDFVFFVLIRHAWSLTPREFYIEYQPWISLIYLAIWLSPWIWLGFVRLHTRE